MINNNDNQPTIDKKNDWFLAVSENPNFQLSNFKQVGLDKTNTGIKEKQFYLDNKYIKEKYTNNEGQFDRIQFDKDYDIALKTYNVFVNDLYDDSPLSDYKTQWRFDSVIRPTSEMDDDLEFYTPEGEINNIFNPDRYTVGIGAIDLISASKKSTEQIARQEQIYDPETGLFEEQSVDDRSLFGDIIGYSKDLFDPLVIATYDEDGEYIDDDGNIQKYFKGQRKLNANGTYYYERLAGRDPIGKEFKSSFDNITKIDSWAHKYDFFDSTKLEKSVGGTMMRTTVKLLPYAFGSKAQAVYGAMNLGLELTGLLSKLYRMHFGNPEDIGGNNNILGVFSGLKDDKVSLHSQENQISFENFAKIVENMVNLKFEQAQLFKTVGKLSGIAGKQAAVGKEVSNELSNLAKSAETIEAAAKVSKYGSSAAQAKMALKLKDAMKANAKLARNISVGYMSLSQGLQTYDEAIAQGVGERDATMIAWGASAGIYGVIRGMGLGEIFLPKEVVLAQKGDPAISKTASSLSKHIVDNVLKSNVKNKAVSEGAKNIRGRLGGLFNKAKETAISSKTAVQLHTANLAQKMAGSGIEEVVQQMFMDLSKGTYNLLDELGYSQNKGTKVEVWEGMLERYASAFAGGAIGAATFHALDFNQMHQQLTKKDVSELTYLANNGRLGELIEFVKTNAKGEGNASKELSATKYEFDNEGNIRYLTAENEADTQNAFVTKKVIDSLKYLQNVLYQEKMDMSEDSLLEHFINAQFRVDSLRSMYENSSDTMKDLVEQGMMGTLFNEYNDLASDFVLFRSKQDQVEKSFSDTQKDTKETNLAKANDEYLALKKNLEEEYAALIERRNHLFSDENILEHTSKTLFAMDAQMHNMFAKVNFKEFVEAKTNKNMWSIPKDQLISLKSEYDVYRENFQKTDIDTGYEVFKKLTNLVGESLELSKNDYLNYINFKKALTEQIVDENKVKEKLVDSITEYASEMLDESGKVKLDKDGNPIRINVGRIKLNQILGKDRNLNDFIRDDLRNIEGARSLLNIAESNNFLDSDVRNMILDMLGDIPYDQISKSFIDSNKQLLASNDPEVESVLKDSISKMDLNNYKEIRRKALSKIKDILINKNLSKEFNDTFNKLMSKHVGSGMDVDPEFLKMKAINETLKSNNVPYLEMVKVLETYNDYLAESTKEYNDIKSRANILSESPLTKILDKMMLEGIGQDEKSLSVIKNLLNNFENIEDINNYQLSDTESDLIDKLSTSLIALKGVLKGALTEKIDLNNSFGHNSVRNEFMRKSGMSGNELVEIDHPLYFMLNADITKLENQLNVLRMVDIENRSNQFKRHERVDDNLIKEVVNSITGFNPKYKFISDLSYGGIKLLEGVKNMPMPVLDAINDNKLDINSLKPEERIELKKYENHVLDTIYDNFQKMLSKDKDTSAVKIVKEMFGDITDKFSYDDIRYQKTSQITDRPSELSDYDILINLLTALTLKKSDFDFMLNNLMKDGSLKYAPLPGQRNAARIALSNILNNDLFNYVIDNTSSEGARGVFRNENSIYIEGGTGVGKTSVTANLIVKSMLSIKPDMEYILAANSSDQIKNLENSLKTDNSKSMTINNLLEAAIGKEEAVSLINDVKNLSEKSKYYEYVDDKDIPHIKVNHDNINYLPASDKVEVIFIDEATFVNSIYLNIISKWAKRNNITVVNIGDNFQNGTVSKIGNTILSNISVPGSNVVIRTPKLSISMRSGNTQQIKNTEKIDNLLSLYDKENLEIDIQTMDDLSYSKAITKRENEIKKELYNTKIHYHQSDKYRLAGEKLIPKFDKAEVDNILKAVDEGQTVGVIYDDINSETVQYIKNSEYVDKVDFFKPNDVQGSERDFIIIDSKILDKGDPFTVYDNLQQINTLFSRAKSGSLIIDKNMSKYINKDNFVEDSFSGIVRNKEDVTNKVKENAISELTHVLGDYEVDPKSLYLNKNKNPELTEVEDPVELPESLKGNLKPSQSSNILNDLLELGNGNLSQEDIVSNPSLSNIRTYGWHLRYGLDYNQETGLWSSIPTEHEYSDLNIFTTKNNLTSEQVNNLEKHLIFIRSYLLSGKEFDSEFTNYLKENGFDSLSKIDWGSGDYYIEVRRYNENIDASQGKVSNKEHIVSDTGLVYDIVYKIPPASESKDRKGYSITMGKLSDPKTWMKFVDKMEDPIKKKEIKKDVESYQSWYNEAGKLVKEDSDLILNYKIDDVIIRKDTLLAPLTDENMNRTSMTVKEMNKQTKNQVIASDIYIYHGNYSKNDSNILKSLQINDSLKGKAVRFVSSHSELIDSKGNKIKITSDNIAELYHNRKVEAKLLFEDKYNELVKTMSKEEAINKAHEFVKDKLPATIRLDVLNPIGMPVKDYLDFNFHEMFNLMGMDKTLKMISTFNSSFVSAKMIANLFNFRANLAIFNDALSMYKSNLSAQGISTNYGLSPEQVVEFNSLLDEAYNSDSGKLHKTDSKGNILLDQGLYAKTNIRLSQDDQFSSIVNESINADYIGLTEEHKAILNNKNPSEADLNIIKELNKTNVGAYMDGLFAMKLETSLNHIFDVISKFITIPNTKSDRRMIISEFKKGDNKFKDLIKALNNSRVNLIDAKKGKRVNSSEMSVFIEGEQKQINSFVGSNSFLANRLLNQLYWLSKSDSEFVKRFGKTRPDSYKYFSTTDVISGKPLKVDIEAIAKSLPNKFMKTLTFILEGNNGNSELKYSAASFKQGVFTTPTFLHKFDQSVGDFSKAINLDWLYTTDVIPELNHVYVNIKPDSLKPVNLKEQYKIKSEDISLDTTPVNMKNIINERINKFKSNIDNSLSLLNNKFTSNYFEGILPKIYKDMEVMASDPNIKDSEIKTMFDDAISSKIKQGLDKNKLTTDFHANDYILEVEYKDGKFIPTKSLFSEMNKQKEFLKINEDGSYDFIYPETIITLNTSNTENILVNLEQEKLKYTFFKNANKVKYEGSVTNPSGDTFKLVTSEIETLNELEVFAKDMKSMESNSPFDLGNLTSSNSDLIFNFINNIKSLEGRYVATLDENTVGNISESVKETQNFFNIIDNNIQNVLDLIRQSNPQLSDRVLDMYGKLKIKIKPFC